MREKSPSSFSLKNKTTLNYTNHDNEYHEKIGHNVKK